MCDLCRMGIFTYNFWMSSGFDTMSPGRMIYDLRLIVTKHFKYLWLPDLRRYLALQFLKIPVAGIFYLLYNTSTLFGYKL